jgi:hypothetical protein
VPALHRRKNPLYLLDSRLGKSQSQSEHGGGKNSVPTGKCQHKKNVSYCICRYIYVPSPHNTLHN